MNFNLVILAGNLTRDPEVRYTPKGTAVANVGLAVNRKWKSESGEQKEEVTFVDLEAFGRTAEVIGQYLKKGRPLHVKGRLKTNSWTDKQTGQSRSKLVVTAEEIQFIGTPEGSAKPASAPSARTAPKQTTMPESDTAAAGAGDDDVPF